MKNSFMRKERIYIITDKNAQRMNEVIKRHLDLSDYNSEDYGDKGAQQISSIVKEELG